MTEKTKYKILLAVVYLYTHGIKINKTRISTYANLSWATVDRYLEDIFPAEFMLDDIQNFHKKYKLKKSLKGGNND